MTTLKELYNIPLFADAMSKLSEKEKQQTEDDIKKLLEKFETKIIQPLSQLVKSDS